MEHAQYPHKKNLNLRSRQLKSISNRGEQLPDPLRNFRSTPSIFFETAVLSERFQMIIVQHRLGKPIEGVRQLCQSMFLSVSYID